ncbi:MAG: D-aminoacylase [Saprospiraceae bacterium]
MKSDAQDFDVFIKNGRIYDGAGRKSFLANIGVIGDKIVYIGKNATSAAKVVIDAKGKVVSPGFIDLHAHLEPLMQMPDAESHVRQGVTLALGGPDGGGLWPFGEELKEISTQPLGMNVAFLIGHNSVRKGVMNLDNRDPTADELTAMKAHVAQAMKDGAFGISTGLKYLPGTFSKVDEVIELAKTAAQYGGFYTSHLREEGLGLIPAVQEAILIGKEAKIPIVLTHHKAIGMPSWGASKKTLSLVDEANKKGLDVQIDQYPYTASYTGISVLIPAWALAGGRVAFKDRISDQMARDSIKKEVIFNIVNDRGAGDISRIQFGKVDWMTELEGKTLADWCNIRNIPATPENGADLVIEAEANGGAGAIYHAIDSKDVDRIMRHPKTMIASDGRLSVPGFGHPHPRAYGTFPRVLGYYVRERKILTLENAIHKMTLLPAKRMGITDRGLIKEGNYADIVIFDPKTIKDKSTFEKPHQYPEGIQYVIVNGVITVDNGVFTENRAGKVLYGPAKE